MKRLSPFLDTNILVYGHVENDPRSVRATEILQRGGVVSIQVLSEFAAVARRKLRLSHGVVDAAITNMLILCPAPIAVDLAIFLDGRRIAERYGYATFDSQIIAAALAAGSTELLSEDMRHGQVIDGRLTLRNPFLAATTP